MIVNCAAYRKGQKLADVSFSEIPRYANEPDCFVWVALKDANGEELETLRDLFDLHPLAVEDAQHGHQRPKIDEYGDSLFVVLHIIELVGEPHSPANDPGSAFLGRELHVGEVAVFAGHDHVISVRRDAQQGFADVRARSEREPDLLKHGPAYVLYALLDAVVDRYFPVIDAITDEIDEIEERIFAGQTTRQNIEALYGIKRKLVVLDRATAPLLEVVGKLHGGRVPPICTGLDAYFRDVHDHLLRLKQTIDASRDMVVTAITVNLSLITINENETTKRLAAYAALCAVPTMIAGVYGMNFQNIPELSWAWGYPFSLTLMVAVNAYLYYRFRKAKWL
jgi:magnesium transporter